MHTASLARPLALSLALTAFASAQDTTRVSIGAGGIEGNWSSYSPSMSSTGRFVTFYSEASNLVPGDTNWADDVFVRDRRLGTLVRASQSSAGLQGNRGSYDSVISANGRFVAFQSDAFNLVPGDTNFVADIFVRDLTGSTTTRVSVDSAGVGANGQCHYASISGNGRLVVFASEADNLVPGDTNGWTDIFLHDRSNGITTRVSVDSQGAQADGSSGYPEISADGRRVVFESRAGNLVAGDSNGTTDIFVRDLASGAVTCASPALNGSPAGSGWYASISGDGRVVSYMSGSPNLVVGDDNGLTDVFVHVLASGVTSRISVSTAGVEANQLCLSHTRGGLSHDGRFAVFKSPASNLVPNDTNGEQDIFLRDRLLGTTTRVNVDSQGAQAWGRSSQPVISADGRSVAFYSFAANLVPNDHNGFADVFLRKLW